MGRVVGKLGDRQPGSPVTVHGFDVGAEDLLDCTMSNLRLAISLRVVGCGEVEGGAEATEKGLPEFCSDASVTVGDDAFGEARDPTIGGVSLLGYY